jgi:hypothetical protein
MPHTWGYEIAFPKNCELILDFVTAHTSSDIAIQLHEFVIFWLCNTVQKCMRYQYFEGIRDPEVGRVAQSVYRLATGWTVRGSNPGEDEILRTRPDRTWGPPSFLNNGYRVFPGGKAAGA